MSGSYERTPEHRAKMSVVKTGQRWTMSPEGRKHISELSKGRPLTLEHRAAIKVATQGRKGFPHTPDELIKMAEAGKKRWTEPEYRANQMVIRSSLEYRDMLAEKWANPEWKHRQLILTRKGQRHKQTKPEKVVETILNEICPKEYKYVGSNGEVVLNGYIPDFININSQKKVIEVFGDYWHGLEHTGRTREEEEILRLNKYAAIGFDCLIIWENEINQNPTSLKARIKAFQKMKHFENQPYLV